MSLPLSKAPANLCLLRLSAIGDVTHALPIVRTLQHYWPETKITWIIGRLEYQLVNDIEGIEFIVFDKCLGVKSYQNLWRALRVRRFDVLLHMQVSLRANIVGLCVPASVRLGFDKKRAKDFQWLFTNARINAVKYQHVLDGFFEFIKALGLNERKLQWDIPIPPADEQWAKSIVGDAKVVVINPSSSQRANNWRNWSIDNYAQLIGYAIEQYGLKVVLTGGPADNEIVLAKNILNHPLFLDKAHLLNSIDDLVAKTSLKQLAALMSQAVAVIAPDTGPAHIANALGRPVIGLYATSNPKRTGPYVVNKSGKINNLTVNKYPEALLKYEGLNEADASWGKRVRNPEALELISLSDVKASLDKVFDTG